MLTLNKFLSLRQLPLICYGTFDNNGFVTHIILHIHFKKKMDHH